MSARLRRIGGQVNKRLGIPLPSPPTGLTCVRPFYLLTIHEDGAVYCCCPSWTRFRLGRLSRNRSLNDLWNSRRARIYRERMLATQIGSCCRPSACPFIADKRLPRLAQRRICWEPGVSGPYDGGLHSAREVKNAMASSQTRLEYPPLAVELSVDERCNLTCPSCRQSRVTELTRQARSVQELVLENLVSLGKDLRRLQLLGNGEVFYSPFALQILRQLNRDLFPRLTVQLLTNGTLLTPHMWSSLGSGRDFVRAISVSVDAATESTYERLRLGGSWERLKSNLEFLRGLRVEGSVDHVSLNFVVSVVNFREMPGFVQLGEALGADQVVFTALEAWRGMAADYEKHAVHLPSHPLHRDLQKVLASPTLASPTVILGLSTNMGLA